MLSQEEIEEEMVLLEEEIDDMTCSLALLNANYSKLEKILSDLKQNKIPVL